VHGTLIENAPQRPLPLTHAKWEFIRIQASAGRQDVGEYAPRQQATECAHETVSGIVDGGSTGAGQQHAPKICTALMAGHRPGVQYL